VVKAKKRITIKDVAAQAGVSYQTVSRVINKVGNVTPSTQLRVQNVIDAMNFRPSQAARTLPSRRTFVIGLIIPYEADYLIKDPNLLAQISGIDAEANVKGYNLLLATAGHAANGLEAYERFIRNQVADGVIVVETASAIVGNEMLAQQGCPYVNLGYDLSHPDAFCVHADDFEGGKSATRHLIERGHRRIGVINGPPTGAIMSLQERLSGHTAALAEANIPFDDSLMVYGDYTRLGGQLATEQLLALPLPPTAIFALNDRMAMGAIRALHALNLRVPQDVAVVGFDDVPAAADFSPALTTVKLPSKEMGQAATQLLFKQIAGVTIANQEVILPTQLIIRQSS